jgi:hypothetical protein
MSVARTQEQIIGFGKKKQADIATANVVGDLWRLLKLNASLSNPKLVVENDAEELGKGHEYPTRTYKTNWDIPGSLEKYLSSEIAAWAMAYGLGKCTPTGTTPNFVYTCIPLYPGGGVDGTELPYFSFIEQIRPGASDVLDRMAVGCAVESWTITIGTGPGRANSKIIIEFVGSGKITDPSGLTIPAATVENLMPAASLAITINGVDYVTNKNIVSLETGWKNNLSLDGGFYPGCGFQTQVVGTFTTTFASNVVTSAGHGLQDNAMVTVSGSALPAGLTAGTVYHVINAATDTMKLSETEGGTEVDITSDGTPPHTMTVLPSTTGAVRGRLEYGNRVGTLRFVARFEDGSLELKKLKAQTTGTAVVSLNHDTYNSLELTWHQLAFSSAEVGDSDGRVTVSVECLPMYHVSNGILTAVAKCNTQYIGA